LPVPNRALACKRSRRDAVFGGRFAASRQRLLPRPSFTGTGFHGRMSWRLHGLPVCGSTESFSINFLPPRQARPAGIQRRSADGHGSSGGVWLSCPWRRVLEPGPALPQNPATAADPGPGGGCRLPCSWKSFGLKARNQVAQRPPPPLPCCSTGRKLRGCCRSFAAETGASAWGQSGIGGSMAANAVPEGAINLPEALGRSMPDQRGGGPLRTHPLGPGNLGGGPLPAIRTGVVIEARQRLHLPPRPPCGIRGENRGQAVATEPGRQPSRLALGERRTEPKHRTF